MREYERWTQPCRSHYAPSSPVPLALTLDPDPEALLNFTCRALGQAGVEPSIVHLETEQGDQLLLAPCVHPSCHPTFQPAYPSLEFSSPSCS